MGTSAFHGTLKLTTLGVFCNANVIKIEFYPVPELVDQRLKSTKANSLSFVFGPLSCISDFMEKLY